ncbi:hypothetical protein FCV25MIE_14412 [Fagus crenata]
MQSLNSVAQRIVLLETPMTRLLVDNGDEIVVSWRQRLLEQSQRVQGIGRHGGVQRSCLCFPLSLCRVLLFSLFLRRN